MLIADALDPTAVWTALGVVVAAVVSVAGIVVGLLVAEVGRLRRENRELAASNTDYLLRMANADRDRRDAEKRANEAEQLTANLRFLSGGKHQRGRPPDQDGGEQ